MTFECRSDEATKQIFPFEWRLINNYRIDTNVLLVSTTVENMSAEEDMLFSVGYHPAFRVPLDTTTSFNDYYLTFNMDNTADNWHLKDGLIGSTTTNCIENGMIRLDGHTFRNDALVFKALKSNEIILKTDLTEHAVRFTFNGFPYLGIWSKPGAGFVCIEPWHGIADSIDHDGNFENKEGIITLSPEKIFRCGYEVAFD